MKGMKVTEAFELPLVIEFVENDEFTLRHESKRQFHAAFKNKDQAYVAANCINHADALADALAAVVKNAEDAAFESWLDRNHPSGDVSEVQYKFEKSSDFKDFIGEFGAAQKALAAYRGAK